MQPCLRAHTVYTQKALWWIRFELHKLGITTIMYTNLSTRYELCELAKICIIN